MIGVKELREFFLKSVEFQLRAALEAKPGAMDSFQHGNFVWHLHVEDLKLLQEYDQTLKSFIGKLYLLGRPVASGYDAPRCLDFKPLVHDEWQMTIRAAAMVDFTLWRNKKQVTVAKLLETMAGQQRPKGFCWYLHPSTIDELRLSFSLQWDSFSSLTHPDATSAQLFNYQVISDKDAPTFDAEAIWKYSVRCTENDKDYHLMNARRWGCTREQAKQRAVFLTYGYTQPMVDFINETWVPKPGATEPPTLEKTVSQETYNKRRSYFREHMPNWFDGIIKKCQEDKWHDAAIQLNSLAAKCVSLAKKEKS